MIDLVASKSKGYGYVTFKKREDAERAIKELNGKSFLDHDLSVCFKKAIKEWDVKANFVMKNFDKKMNTGDLLNFIRSKGFSPVSGSIIYDRKS